MTIRYVVLKAHKRFFDKEGSLYPSVVWRLGETSVASSLAAGHMIYGPTDGVEFNGECIIATGLEADRERCAEIARRTRGRLERWEYHSGGVRCLVEKPY